MNREPLVSILVPCYNNQQHIYETLKSIFYQTYKNIEVLIGDDCSNDFNAEELLLWIKKHCPPNIENILLIENSINKGTVFNVENLQYKSKGEFFFPIAADDVLYDEYVIENFVSTANAYGEKYEVFTAQTELWDRNLQYKLGEFVSEADEELLKSEQTITILEQVCYRCLIPASNFYRHTVLNKIGNLSEQYRLVEDWPTHLRLLRMGVKFHYVDICSIKHRDGGISKGNSRYSNKTFLEFYCDYLNVFTNEVEQCSDLISDEAAKRAKTYFFDRLAAYWTIHRKKYIEAEKEKQGDLILSNILIQFKIPIPNKRTMRYLRQYRAKRAKLKIKKGISDFITKKNK